MVLTNSELTNAVGRLDLEINQIQKYANSTDDHAQDIETCIQNCIKLLNTISSKQGITKTSSSYTDNELKDMRIIATN